MIILRIITFLLPWPLRRRALESWFNFEIHPTANIGFAWVFPRQLIMAAGTRIDHFTVAINLDRIEMEEGATIGRGNWITGFPTDSNSPHFQHQHDRQAMLRLGRSAAITKNHHLDCTNLIDIGPFATIAGYHSQFLTHAIHLGENRQHSTPIRIGAYTFIGTNVVVLGGSILPAHSILGAKSLLNKAYTTEWTLYGGVPATILREVPKSAKYFSRTDGFVF